VSLRSLSSSALPTGKNSAFTSTRSSNGPDSRARYRRRTSGVQEHAAREDVAREQGHGLAASLWSPFLACPVTNQANLARRL